MPVEIFKQDYKGIYPVLWHILQRAGSLDDLIRLSVEDREGAAFIFVDDVFFLHHSMIANARVEWKWRQSFSVTPRRMLAIDIRAASDIFSILRRRPFWEELHFREEHMTGKPNSRDAAALSAGAVALSNSATLAALISHLRRIGAVSAEAERDIYENALEMLEEGQGDDHSGVFAAARDLIGEHLKPHSSKLAT